jgi:thiamine pyrophosphokinase
MKRSVVILANGSFPRADGPAGACLAAADTVVCCDGAADAYRRRFRREPEAVVGDCDSVKGRFSRIVRIADQETNDLEKAIAYCRARGWRDPVIVGAVGRRDDHALGNVFRAFAAGLVLLTDKGRFEPLVGRRTFSVEKGAAVSVFAPDPATRMTSSGLQWPLDGVVFRNLYCATLNRAVAQRLTLTADRPVYVYIAFPEKGRRA